MMNKWFIVVGFFLLNSSIYSQSVDTLKIRAALFVHADFTNFHIDDSLSSIRAVSEEYKVVLLETFGIHDCYIFKVTYDIPIDVKDCVFYIAYNSSNYRFYRLSGFRNSDFSLFYNSVLAGGGVHFLKQPPKGKKLFKLIYETVSIEEVDLKEMYGMYYKNLKNELYDPLSCYYKYVREYTP